ncbi:traB domain-containing protein-like [Macadamia integrifolia]|uniref:traB domain-containing protein-like n=1 Tax=Macadamia integrifolia TaxID=60698 RepID=UPI001C4EF014|nr:traB domain-containing protein-like [Macadamia integrifolia]
MNRQTRLINGRNRTPFPRRLHVVIRRPEFSPALFSSFISKRTEDITQASNLRTEDLLSSPSLAAEAVGNSQFKIAMETDASPVREDFVSVQNLKPVEISVDEREDLNSSSEISQNPQSCSETSSRKIASVDDVRSEDVVSVPTDSQTPESTLMEAEGDRVLPDELAKSVVMLECESSAEGGSCDVYLVGTAHVSQESCREVQAIISHLKPQVVFLELCSSRITVLAPQNLQVPTMKEMIDMWQKKKMNMFGILYSWFLAKLANKLEVFPGSEFRVAFEQAMQYGGKVILGDRPVHVTLRRTWGKMSLWHKAKFLYSILFQAIFLPSPEDLNKMLKEMDDVDMLTLVIQEMSKEFPTLMETLIFERDLYMSSTLLRVASEHASVVAVVGKGHLQGIKRHWKQPIDVKGLLEIPARRPTVSAMKILKSLGVVVVGAAIISGFYLAGKS